MLKIMLCIFQHSHDKLFSIRKFCGCFFPISLANLIYIWLHSLFFKLSSDIGPRQTVVRHGTFSPAPGGDDGDQGVHTPTTTNIMFSALESRKRGAHIADFHNTDGTPFHNRVESDGISTSDFAGQNAGINVNQHQ